MATTAFKRRRSNSYVLNFTLTYFLGLVRFIPRRDANLILIGEPVDESVDVGSQTRRGHSVPVYVWSGSSMLNPGRKTDQRELIDRILAPMAPQEIGSIRCIGLNVGAL
jgi:hypothetical protein